MRKMVVQLRNLGLLTVGSAYPRQTMADVSTVRVNGRVIIPGSSFKGALRTAAHRAAPRIGQRSCGEIEPGRIIEAHRKIGGKCDVCDLFGMPGPAATSSSKLLVTDLMPRNDVKTTLMTRVSIEPESLRALKGGLFTMEVIPICTIFEGEIILLSDDDRHLRLLLASLEDLMSNTMGRGAIMEIKVERIPDSMLESFGQLREWRWNICP